MTVHKHPTPLAPPDDAGTVLLPLARAAIEERLEAREPRAAVADHPDWLDTPGASFVTLTEGGELRGCIGSLEARRPLGDDVRANAANAALRDPRFTPLTAAELPRVRIEVSVLSPAEPMAARTEAEAIAELRPGIDGVVLDAGPRRATFLPQVWQEVPAPARFLALLRRKAGLPTDLWRDSWRLSRYTVRAWQEDPR